MIHTILQSAEIVMRLRYPGSYNFLHLIWSSLPLFLDFSIKICTQKLPTLCLSNIFEYFFTKQSLALIKNFNFQQSSKLNKVAPFLFSCWISFSVSMNFNNVNFIPPTLTGPITVLGTWLHTWIPTHGCNGGSPLIQNIYIYINIYLK